jgi:hypothetical protein
LTPRGQRRRRSEGGACLERRTTMTAEVHACFLL